ncbi:hypothetical protein [Simkania sp.]|uniref:hypothetical protein n=1 Tax=Simkania sp. TaxID=34094 RepID=UPI003B5218D3
MCCCLSWCNFWEKPKAESQYLFIDPSRSKETTLETTERFTRLIPKFGVTLDAFELETRSHQKLGQWTVEDCTHLHSELRKVHSLLGGKWRLHSNGGSRVQITFHPVDSPPGEMIQRTLFGGVELSATDHQVTKRLHESYGTFLSDHYEVSLDEPKPFWNERQILVQSETVQIVYPPNPIDIDGYGRHFVIATKHNGFGEIEQSVFRRCLECIRYLTQHLAKPEDEVHILAGGDLDGTPSMQPWHMQVIIFEPLSWSRESRTVQNALKRERLSESEYQGRMKDFIVQLPS